MISEFLSGLITVCTLLAVGCALALILQKVVQKYQFTRLSLVLALTPLSLIHFMDRRCSSTLFIYSTIVILLGIIIDGINFLLLPKEPQAAPDENTVADSEDASADDVIVWEKAE